MRVLVTNDDGIFAPGLRAIAGALVDAGFEVLVAAPGQDCSGQGASLGPLHVDGRIEFERVSIAGLDAEAVSVQGPPALCVMSACLGGFGPAPEVVVSGINAGTNTGRAVLHSGTVGAALTALNFGIPGLAISQVAGDGEHLEAAATMSAGMVEGVARLRPPVTVNLNLPDLPLGEIRGPVPARLDPGGVVQAALVESHAGVLQLQVPRAQLRPAGTDTALVADGFATLTALAGPHLVTIDLAGLCEAGQVAGAGAGAGSGRRVPA